MKPLFLVTLLSLSFVIAKAQEPKRNIAFKVFERDSVNFPLTDDYYLIEDSCALVTRYAHFNFEGRVFKGKFKDVSRADSKIIVGEGAYNEFGEKDGDFVSRYINGNLRGRGKFRDNKYDGKWEMFYENGKPELSFEVDDAGQYTITDAWAADGTKLVDHGTGIYTADLGEMYWKGKLTDGKPDGTWKMMHTNDVNKDVLLTEYFKKGKFTQGENANRSFTYKDVSKVVLVNLYKLPLVNIEQMAVSPTPCSGTKFKHVVEAQYKKGYKAFMQEIAYAVGGYLGGSTIQRLDNSFIVDGQISEKGTLTMLNIDKPFNEGIARNVIKRLKDLPTSLQPATVDGAYVPQKFKLTFIFANNSFEYLFQLQPIPVN